MRYGTCFAALLAGGAGTRFWPASRRHHPKPFVDILGRGPLVAETWQRIVPVVDPDHIFLVLGDHLVDLARVTFPQLSEDRFLREPVARSTLGAVVLSLGFVRSRRKEKAVLGVFPTDHVIDDTDRFRVVVDAAYRTAREAVVGIGLLPRWPDTGFGYIESGSEFDSEALTRLCLGPTAPRPRSVGRFVEKPDLETAQRFVTSGRHFWNSGMFFFETELFMDILADVDSLFSDAAEEATRLYGNGIPDPETLKHLLSGLPNTSIDKAVMEKCKCLAVVPGDFDWTDLGTWDAVFEQRPAGSENFVSGSVYLREALGNVVVALPGAPTVLVSGLSDVIVVATPDGILVTRRGSGQNVRHAVALLDRDGRDDLL